MSKPQTIGLPRMLVEPGEKRVFLPDFVNLLRQLGLHVFMEEGYGSRLGYSFADFRRGNESIHQVTREEAFFQDIVLILRAPKMEDFNKLGSNSILISMLHFPTRPKRVAALQKLNIKAISIDSIVDDYNIRRVENMASVAWNGIETAFDVLEQRFPHLSKPDESPFQVLILGTGMVGKHAVEAAVKLGNLERYNDHIAADRKGSVAFSIGRAVTRNLKTMENLMSTADVLVDATQRRNPSLPVIPNSWIHWLPDHAVLVDLSVDPYLPNGNPPVVRGIEGIPQGNLDHYIFYPDDPIWNATIPENIPAEARRTTVSCYSWPGIHPEASMEHYARQLAPFMRVLVSKGYDSLSLDGPFFERALYRGTLKYFLSVHV